MPPFPVRVRGRLFEAGNSVALDWGRVTPGPAGIAKFLGHESLETTNRYYLRMAFQEVLSRIKLPDALLL